MCTGDTRNPQDTLARESSCSIYSDDLKTGALSFKGAGVPVGNLTEEVTAPLNSVSLPLHTSLSDRIKKENGSIIPILVLWS